jgi:hypothetical protein
LGFFGFGTAPAGRAFGTRVAPGRRGACAAGLPLRGLGTRPCGGLPTARGAGAAASGGRALFFFKRRAILRQMARLTLIGSSRCAHHRARVKLIRWSGSKGGQRYCFHARRCEPYRSREEAYATTWRSKRNQEKGGRAESSRIAQSGWIAQSRGIAQTRWRA